MSDLKSLLENLEAAAREATKGEYYLSGSCSVGRTVCAGKPPNGKIIAYFSADQDAALYSKANPATILQLTQRLREAAELIKTNRRYIMSLTEKQCTDVQLMLDLNDAFLARWKGE